MPVDWDATVLGLSVLELVAAAFGLVSVALTVKENVWCWPVGVVMVLLYFVVFWRARLYADMGLQAVYFVLQFYGWHQWLHGSARSEPLAIRRTGGGLLVLLIVLGAAGTAGLGFSLSRFTDAAVPYWDSAATAFSLVAQYMLARKLLESWLVWVAVDVLSIGIYLYKELYPTTVLYVLFLIMASLGYREWKMSCRPPRPA